MQFAGKGKKALRIVQGFGERWAGSRRFCLVAVFVVLVGIALLVFGQCSRAAFEEEVIASSGEQGNTLEIVVACGGWTDENVEVGMFVSGNTLEGDPVDEQAMFQGSGSQTIQLNAGRYEVVPQLPRLMLVDGTVLEAGEPATYCLEAVSHAMSAISNAMTTAAISYVLADVSDIGDEELAGIAAVSFLDGEVADRACVRAREKRVV